MLTELAVLGLVVFIAKLAKWIIDPYLAWKKNYQARGQEYPLFLKQAHQSDDT
jgi:hypothetical protein